MQCGTARFTNDQAGLKTYYLWCRIMLLQAFKQELSCFLSYLVRWLANRCQAGMHDCCPLEIIEAHECNVLWAAQSNLRNGLQGTDDHQAVRHEKRRGLCGFLGQELKSRARSSIYPRIAFSDQCRIVRNAVGFERLLISGQPLFRRSDTGETRHNANPLVPKCNQVVDRLSSARHVVHENGIDVQLRRKTVDVHQWQPLGRPGA